MQFTIDWKNWRNNALAIHPEHSTLETEVVSDNLTDKQLKTIG